MSVMEQHNYANEPLSLEKLRTAAGQHGLILASIDSSADILDNTVRKQNV